MKITADWIKNGEVTRLFSAFESQGYQIFFVGGCVRNTLLNRPVSDLDVSTSATPEQTIAMAKASGFKFIPTGLDHGTITVIVGDFNFEITSFRKDVETHGRRAVVAFSTSIMDDALRRDFTMNALYADGSGTVIDPLNGMKDLQNRKVRFIENAQDRIQEDYLRILRYFRFHAYYADQDDGMDADALAAIAGNIDGLSLVSKERIGSEFRKILSAPDPLRTLAAMEQTGVLGQILSGANARTLGPLLLLEESLNLETDWQRRLIALSGQDQANALRLSKTETKRLTAFKKAMDLSANTAETAYRFGRETTLDVALVTAASLESHPAANLLEQIDKGCAATFEVRASDLPQEFEGKSIGDTLRLLEDRWIASGFTATKHELLANV
jgi:poly(A) polymerase